MEDVRLRFPILLASPRCLPFCRSSRPFDSSFPLPLQYDPIPSSDRPLLRQRQHSRRLRDTLLPVRRNFLREHPTVSPVQLTTTRKTQGTKPPSDAQPKRNKSRTDGKTHKRLNVDPHLGRRAIELHIVLANLATILHGLDARAQAVRLDGAVGQAGVGDEEEAYAGGEGLLRGGLG